MSLPPSTAPTATGWSDSCRAGFAPAEEWRLCTAHGENLWLTRQHTMCTHHPEQRREIGLRYGEVMEERQRLLWGPAPRHTGEVR